MKKVIAIFAIAATLVACEVGSTKTEATTVDSTVSVDSTTVDSVAAATTTPTAEVK